MRKETPLHPSKTRVRLKLLTAWMLALTVVACGGGNERPDGEDALTRVMTTHGPVRGTAGPSMVQFKGIPYAAPPIGALRWRAPQAPVAWTQERQAQEFGPACAQPASAFGTPSPTTNEDCLTLNVFRPRAPGPHPVMVWIHGGAFYLGSSTAYPDVSSLVGQNVVVVTLNYRLGALGFMAHPALSGVNVDARTAVMMAHRGLSRKVSIPPWRWEATVSGRAWTT